MNNEEIRQRKKAIEARYGPWTAHDILLPGGIRTLDHLSGDLETTKAELRAEVTDADSDYALHLQSADFWGDYSPGSSHLRRMVQVVADLSGQPWESLRVLDLACMEGGFSFEFGQRGAEVLGVEGREAHVAKAEFARQALGLHNVSFVQDDVRNVDMDSYGRFDVILCIGLLYHLDADSVFSLLERLAAMCDRLLVLDTHVSLHPHVQVHYKGKSYWGVSNLEHRSDATADEKQRNLWQSLDNVESFQPTRFSLFNFLQSAGFSSVFECNIPPMFWDSGNRGTFVALNGEPISQVHTSREDLIEEQYSEIDSGRAHSELHVLSDEHRALTGHPYVRLGRAIAKFWARLRGLGGRRAAGH